MSQAAPDVDARPAAPLVPSVCIGWLRHRRFSPVAHEFRYPLFMVLLDVDRLSEQMEISRFTSYNRWNWATFDDRDHFGLAMLPLRERLASDAARNGLTLPDGRIFMLTHLRYLGYCFNPVSFFYCHDRAGALRLVLAEVNNTFGGSHNYWLEDPASSAGGTSHLALGTSHTHLAPRTSHPAPGAFRSAARKSLYVSPFMESALDYAFALTTAADRLVVHMTVSQRESAAPSPEPSVPRPEPPVPSPLFDATLSLEQRPWSAREIRRALLRHPMMTARVVAGIHWEALRLWRKGMKVAPRATPRGVYPAIVERPVSEP